MSAEEATASTLAKAANQLKEGARVHKRSVAAHRRALVETNKALEEIEGLCRALGIELHVYPTQPKGGHSR